MTDATLRQALAFAARGWPVLPCQPGQKTPATRHGVRDATTDPGQITAWFGRHPDWNLAIATGAPGPDVLDVDQHGDAGNGYAAFRQLRTAGLLDGARAYVRTPSGGLHAYFTGTDQRNGHLPGCHLDFRSRGGYVLTPPSQIGGKPYQLIQTLRRPRRPGLGRRHPATCNPSASPRPGIPSPAARTSAAWPGGSPARAKATATPACSGPPTAPWTADPAADLSPLAAAARQAGLDDKEITRTLDSARKTGQPARPHPTTKPRQVRHDRPHRPARRPRPRQPRPAGGRPRSPDPAPAAGRDLPRRSPPRPWLSPDTVHALASGRRRAQPGTATAVLTVISPALPHARLDATGTRLRLRALHVMGHGSARIARATGVHPTTIRKLVRGDARTVSAQLRDAIAALYDAWWDKRAPGRTRFERAAATAARNRAMAGDWCAAGRAG